MTTARIIPVLLAGGAGSRLWPVSRDSLPKQFQPLTGPLSTFQQTLERVSDPVLFEEPIVITSYGFRFFAKGQAAAASRPISLVLEPCRRDSAAAVAVAALLAEQTLSRSPVLVLAADHVILDDDLFLDAVRSGLEAAVDGRIVVFGLRPTEPKTTFGYIRPGARVGANDDVRLVDAFVEKPNRDDALAYLKAGYLWNSGNFLFRSDVMIREFEKFAPEVLAAARRSIEAARKAEGFMQLDETAFAAAPKTSIDYAIVERSRNIAVVVGRFRWSDIGSWDAIWEILPRDQDGNAMLGRGIAVDSKNCLVHSEAMLTTVIGGTDLVVVSTVDAVLVASREHLPAIKGLVERLQAEGAKEATAHHRDVRSWGRVESIDEGCRFAVKRLVVDPGRTLSAHCHTHRAEHWIVVKGIASAVIDGVARTLVEGESLYLPIAAMHRLSNRGTSPLELIEVRIGAGLGEDDIPRFDDVAGGRMKDEVQATYAFAAAAA
jgi:mannose-1-phosphate guanylyltransferase / mannose-6-phosphate isomerase